MAIPVYSIGQVLAASDVNEWLVAKNGFRATDASRVTNTTLVSDSSLSVPMTANGWYHFWLFLVFSGSSTGDFKWAFAPLSGAVAQYSGVWDFTGAGGPVPFANALTTVQSVNIGVTNTLYAGRFEGTVRCDVTAGNLQVQYAENATDAVTGSYIAAHSSLTAQRIA